MRYGTTFTVTDEVPIFEGKVFEKRIELSQKFNMNNFILICKSDYLGNVNMPKIKFIINEDNKIKEEISCDSLLHFNCISKEE